MITPEHLTPVVKALVNLGGLTLGDKNQAATWAAYIATEVPIATPADLMPAVPIVLRWHSEKGSYGHVTAADYAQAVRHVAAKRPKPRCPRHPYNLAGMCLPCKQANDPRILTSQGEPA